MSRGPIDFLDVEFSQAGDGRGNVDLTVAIPGQDDRGVTLSFQGRPLDGDEVPAFCDVMSEIFDMIEARRPKRPVMQLVASRDKSLTP